jgi:hypothetical protein
MVANANDFGHADGPFAGRSAAHYVEKFGTEPKNAHLI